MSVLDLALCPRDGYFCKDGRGWTTTASGRTHALDWPFPSTVRGALRTAWGFEHERSGGGRLEGGAWPERTAGVTLECLLPLRRPAKFGTAGREQPPWSAEHRMWPVPADALGLDGEACVFRLEPEPQPQPPRTLGRDEDPAREALWWPPPPGKAKPEPPPRFWPEGEFTAWLAGHTVAKRSDSQALALPTRTDIHLAIDPQTFTASRSQLYSNEVVEPMSREWEWALGVSCGLAAGSIPDRLLFGGDRRIVRCEPVGPATFGFPGVLEEAFARRPPGLRLFVVTPAYFPDGGWLPPGFTNRSGVYCGELPGVDGELTLRAAFVPRPVHASGWDMAARGPKATRRLVPSGAVYFLTRERPFAPEEARELWLAALGDAAEDGFGRVVPGVWTPKKEGK